MCMITKMRLRVIPSFLYISVGDITDYKKWSESFDQRVESFKLDERRFVRFEDRKNESILTLENNKGISKGKMGITLLQSLFPRERNKDPLQNISE